MNKQTKREVDKEAKKIVQEEISQEIGVIQTELDELTEAIQKQPSNTFDPNELIQQIQQNFEDTQKQLREIQQQLADLVEIATPLLNKSGQPYQNATANQQNPAIPLPYSQYGSGQLQQTTSQMDQMSRPIAEQNYGQNLFYAQNQFSQNTNPVHSQSAFNPNSGQGTFNQSKPFNSQSASFNQPNSYAMPNPNYYGYGNISNEQTSENDENRNF